MRNYILIKDTIDSHIHAFFVRFILILILFQLCDPLNKAVNLRKVKCKKTDRNRPHALTSTFGEYLTSFRDKSLQFLHLHLILTASMNSLVLAAILGAYFTNRWRKLIEFFWNYNKCIHQQTHLIINWLIYITDKNKKRKWVSIQGVYI